MNFIQVVLVNEQKILFIDPLGERDRMIAKLRKHWK